MTQPQYFLKRGEKVFGPHSVDQIKMLDELGKLYPTDLVSKSKDGSWHKFGDVAEKLFPSKATSEPTPRGYFIRRGQKIIGPYLATQIKKLDDSGKLAITDDVSKSKTGPWEKYGMLSDEIQIEAFQQPEYDPVTSGNYKGEDIGAYMMSSEVHEDRAAQHSVAVETFTAKDSIDLNELFSGDEHAYDIPEFDSAVDVPPPGTLPPFTNAYRSPRPNYGSESREEEVLKFGGGWWLLPWRAEQGGTKYWSLKMFLQISHLVFKFAFCLMAYVLPPLLLLLMLANLDLENAFKNGDFFVVVFVFFPVVFVIWFALCHLFYVVNMATVDLLRVVLDIEKNTR